MKRDRRFPGIVIAFLLAAFVLAPGAPISPLR